MLVMGMSNKKQQIPTIRFKGFTDSWEQRKFGYLWGKSSERNADLKYSRQEVLSVAQMKLNTVERNSSDDYMKKYNVLHYGDIAFEGNKSKDYSFGRFVLNDIQDGIVSHVFITFRPKVKMNIDFMKIYINNENVMKHLLVKVTTKTLMMTTLNVQDMNKQFMNIPNLDEQAKIGTFFKQLNDTIDLHQRQFDNYKEMKKAMLQNMFTRNGEDFPDVRFIGFTEAWNQHTLDKYLKTSKVKNSSGFFDKEHVLSVSGDYGIVNQIEFQGRSFAGESVLNYGVVNNGDIVYTKSPLKANPHGIIKTNKGKSGIVSTLYAVYNITELSNSDFIQTYFEDDSRLNQYLKPLVNKGAKNDMKVTDDNALKGIVIFPSYDEQIKIASFFKQLDATIASHKKKIDSYQQLKKNILQQMLV